jgi:putative SOS response-associated peptidase YedK
MRTSDPDEPRPDFDAPTAHGPGRLGSVVRLNPRTGERDLDQLVWGLLPHDTKNPSNAHRPIMARAETVATRPLFASAFRNRRAIVPMSVYYQRRATGGPKERFAIFRKDGEPMAVAGLWESFTWPDGRITRTYCIITTVANALVAPINGRMPVVLEQEDWPVWLGEQPGDPESLLRPPSADILRYRPIGDGRTKWQRDLF